MRLRCQSSPRRAILVMAHGVSVFLKYGPEVNRIFLAWRQSRSNRLKALSDRLSSHFQDKEPPTARGF